MKPMKIFLTALILLLSIVSSGSVGRVEAATLDYDSRVAVIPFKVRAAVDADLMQEDRESATEYVTIELEKCGRFIIEERERLSDLLDESVVVGSSGLIDPATAARIGMLEGAQYLFLGSITDVSVIKKVGQVAGVGGKSFKVSVDLTARIVDVETGRVVLAGTGSGTSTSRVATAPLRLIRIGRDEVNSADVKTAMKKASAELVKDMIDALDKRQSR